MILDSMLLVAGIAVAAAALMAVLWRSAEARAVARSEQCEALEQSLSASRIEVEKISKARQRQGEELADLRKRADKAKRRGGKHAPQPMGTASRIQDLEEAGAKASRERDALRSERDRLTQEVNRLTARLAADALAAEAARERAQDDAARAVASMPAAATAEPDARAALEASLAEARERILKLEGEQQIARQTEARMRKRMDNQEQLYASIRSELDAKKDRLRTQEEQLQRLQALKVAVLE